MQVRVRVKESNFLVETNNQFEDFDFISVEATSSSSSSLGNGFKQLKGMAHEGKLIAMI